MLIAWSRFWPRFRTNLVSGPRTDWCRRNRDGKCDSECVNMDMYTHLRTALATEHFNTTGHTINDALSSRNYALRGKCATEAPGEAPDFSAWHQSSTRPKLRLPFPLGHYKVYFYLSFLFFYFMAYANLSTILRYLKLH